MTGDIGAWTQTRIASQETAAQISRVIVHEITSAPPAAQQPSSTGSREWDAFVAATAARHFHVRGLPAPSWTKMSPLDPAWAPLSDLITDDAWFKLSVLRTPVEYLQLGIVFDRINLENL